MEPGNPATPSGREASTSSSSLPDLRSLYEWVDTIPLSRPRRNLARDFSDAVLAAEVVGFLWPEGRLFGCGNGGSGSSSKGGPAAVPAFQPANSTSGKIYNWCVFRERVLRKLGVPATRGDVEAAARGEPGAAEWILAMLRQRAERGGGSMRTRAAATARAAAAAASATTAARAIRKGGGLDVASAHSYAPSSSSFSPSSFPPLISVSNKNCRGGWRAAALAARVCGGSEALSSSSAAAPEAGTAAKAARVRTSRGWKVQRRVLSSPTPLLPPKKTTANAAAAAAEAAARSRHFVPAPSPAAGLASDPGSSSSALFLERENAALKSQVARLERLALRQEAQIEALLEALEDASATAAAAAAAAEAGAAAAAAPSPVAAENELLQQQQRERQQQKILSSGSTLKFPGGGVSSSSSSFPLSSPLRALEGAVLIGRC